MQRKRRTGPRTIAVTPPAETSASGVTRANPPTEAANAMESTDTARGTDLQPISTDDANESNKATLVALYGDKAAKKIYADLTSPDDVTQQAAQEKLQRAEVWAGFTQSAGYETLSQNQRKSARKHHRELTPDELQATWYADEPEEGTTATLPNEQRTLEQAFDKADETANQKIASQIVALDKEVKEMLGALGDETIGGDATIAQPYDYEYDNLFSLDKVDNPSTADYQKELDSLTAFAEKLRKVHDARFPIGTSSRPASATPATPAAPPAGAAPAAVATPATPQAAAAPQSVEDQLRQLLTQFNAGFAAQNAQIKGLGQAIANMRRQGAAGAQASATPVQAAPPPQASAAQPQAAAPAPPATPATPVPPTPNPTLRQRAAGVMGGARDFAGALVPNWASGMYGKAKPLAQSIGAPAVQGLGNLAKGAYDGLAGLEAVLSLASPWTGTGVFPLTRTFLAGLNKGGANEEQEDSGIDWFMYGNQPAAAPAPMQNPAAPAMPAPPRPAMPQGRAMTPAEEAIILMNKALQPRTSIRMDAPLGEPNVRR